MGDKEEIERLRLKIESLKKDRDEWKKKYERERENDIQYVITIGRKHIVI
jgi:hypothetical protein